MPNEVFYILLLITSIIAFCSIRGMIKFQARNKELAEMITPKMKELFGSLRAGLDNVLVVDDDALQRELIEMKLIPADCKVHQATTKEEALSLINNNEYDLIFLDIKLAGENGENILKTMRANNNETSVVIITGYADQHIYQLGAQLNAPVIEKQNLIRHIDFWSKTFLKQT